MEMTENEICREYRTARDKKRQVGILADCKLTGKTEILAILSRGGEKLPDANARCKSFGGRKRREEEHPDDLIAEMERIEREIGDLEKQYCAVASRVKRK